MIRFSKYIWFYFIISAIVLVPGIYSLLRWGLRPAIDFTGGILLELKIPNVEENDLSLYLKSADITSASIQKTAAETYILRIKPEDNQKLNNFQQKLKDQFKEAPEVVRHEEVGPILGKELLQKTVTAAVIAVVIILLYVAYAFRDLKFGVAAIVALIHDLLVILGIFSLLGHFYQIEVDTLFVTAFLTTMSFSVHDTIVVFDRIREYLKKDNRNSLDIISDHALSETMNRSLINSLTIIFMLLALVLLGGDTVRWFAFALLVGTVSGTYSSPFIATPVLLLWKRINKS